MKPRPKSLRVAVLASALLVALGLFAPLTAGAQEGARGDDRIPSELWRTYPLSPGDGATTIERMDAPAPAPSTGAQTGAQTVPVGEPAPAGERPSADSESSSGAGAVVILALCALGVLASLLALFVFPAGGAMRMPARWTSAGSSTRNALGRLERIPHRASAGIRRWSEVAARPILARRPAAVGPAPVRPVPPSSHAGKTHPSAGGRGPNKGRSQQVEKLKEKTTAKSQKERKRIADAEAQTLKRKLSTETGGNALRAKRERAGEPLERTSPVPKPSPTAERGTTRADEPAAAQPPVRPAPEPTMRREAALRPVGGREPPPRARLVAVELPPGCRIIWWRGYVKSRFIAVAEPDGEGNAVIAASPFFRWRRAEPPPETPEIAQAFRTLVEGLEQRGWRVSRRGRRWFSLHMQLTFGEEPVQTRQFEGPEAGRKGTMS